MAGNYPDVPSWRMAYDRDGTSGYILTGTSSIVSQLSSVQMAALNNEASGGVNLLTGQWLAFVFPEARDLDAIFIDASVVRTGVIEVSTNSTNGIDGTWSSLPNFSIQGLTLPRMRTAIQSTTALAIRAVRINPNMNNDPVYSVHLYGEIAPGENPHRLSIVKEALDERIAPAYLDWGNVPRSSTADKTFRVKNLSPSLTAVSIRVALDALTDTTPSVPAQHTLSYGGGSFLAQVNIGNLAPGAISGPITIRRITPSNAVLSLWWLRTFAAADSWS